MGTESNGGFKNVTISNCVFDYSRGLALETVDGGLLEDVSITNITMRDIVNAPIFIRLGARLRAPDSIPIGACRRIILSNIVIYNADYRHGVIISGLPGHEIEDLQMSNIRIYYKGGGTADMAGPGSPRIRKRLSGTISLWQDAGIRILPAACKRPENSRRGDQLPERRTPARLYNGRCEQIGTAPYHSGTAVGRPLFCTKEYKGFYYPAEQGHKGHAPGSGRSDHAVKCNYFEF